MSWTLPQRAAYFARRGVAASGALLLALAALGCSADPAAEPEVDPCAHDPFAGELGSTCLSQVTGRVVDEAGAPIAGLSLSVCGAVCFTTPDGQVSDAEGRFAVPIGARVTPAELSLSAHGRPRYAGYYRALPTAPDSSEVDLGDQPVLELPASGPELVVKGSGAPAQSVTSGDVTLEIPAGTELRLDVEDVALGDVGRQLRVASPQRDNWPRFLGSLTGALAVYALAPFESSFRTLEGVDTTARVTLVNRTGLGAGARVEVLALGTYQFADWLTPAAFERVAQGTVSSDGATITLDSGAGLAHLTWIVLKELS